MPIPSSTWLPILALAVASLAGTAALRSQSALSGSRELEEPEFLIQLDAYVKYGGDIRVIDGLTGESYHSDNQIVKTIHTNFPKIMGGLHNKLLALEWEHMNFHLTHGVLHEKQLAELADSFGIKGFRLDRENWLSREKAILSRLRSAPFFQIKELVVWELEGLNQYNPPQTEYAKNIRFNEETNAWERRVITEWKVVIPQRNGGRNLVIKNQGLNLETNRGFHKVLDQGLPGNVHPSNFKEVPVSYPIIISRRQDTQEQIDRLQRQIVLNMSHLYDPFTWIARRDTRFRTHYYTGLHQRVKSRSLKFKDRGWFDGVLAHFLNDVVTVKLYGLREVYDLYVAQNLDNPGNTLGVEFDLLHWDSGDKWTAQGGKKNRRVWLNFKNSNGGRFALLDLYLRYGDKVVENLRSKYIDVKSKTEGRTLVLQTIEEVSGIPAEKYIEAALKAQRKSIEEFYQSSRT